MADRSQKPPPLEAPKGIIAYHGSPHTFDRFDMSKIGTGEGAQAFGHGLYFADNEDVARGYRAKLAGKGLSLRQTVEKYLPGSPSDSVLASIYSQAIHGNDDLDRAARAVQGFLPELRDPNTPFVGPLGENGKRIADAIADIRAQHKGAMYQVRLNVGPEQLLDWDVPLGEQTETVRRAFGWTPDAEAEYRQANKADADALAAALEGDASDYRSVRLPVPKGVPPLSATGADIMGGNNLFGRVSDPSTSLRLRDAGIAGLRYRDGGSRGPDRWTLRHTQGGVQDFPDEAAARAFANRYPGQYTIEPPKISRNYVMFDDKLVDILKRYAIPVGIAGATYAALQPQPAAASTGDLETDIGNRRRQGERGVIPRLALGNIGALDPTGATAAVAEGYASGEDVGTILGRVPDRAAMTAATPLALVPMGLGAIGRIPDAVARSMRPVPASAQPPRQTIRTKAPPLPPPRR